MYTIRVVRVTNESSSGLVVPAGIPQGEEAIIKDACLGTIKELLSGFLADNHLALDSQLCWNRPYRHCLDFETVAYVKEVDEEEIIAEAIESDILSMVKYAQNDD